MSYFNYSNNSDCSCCNPVATPKDTLPPSYNQLGAAKSLQCVQELFVSLSGLDASLIKLQEIYWTREKPKNLCRPYKNVLSANEKLTVLVKRQTCESESHLYTVVAILIKDILDDELLNNVKSFYEKILPVVKYLPRGRTDKIVDCKCNYGETQGGSKTFGCSAHAVNKSKCKFAKRPANLNKGRKKFDVVGKHVSNDPNLESVTNLLADIASHQMLKLAPLSFSNMLAHAKKAPSCCIGQQFPSIFGGVTLVADYTAHSHRDVYDCSKGAVAIFSFTNDPKNEKQFHCLPHYVFHPNNDPGIAIDTGDNSLLLEVAVHEDHATTPLLQPNGKNPNRLALVFFRHECLNAPDHGSN